MIPKRAMKRNELKILSFFDVNDVSNGTRITEEQLVDWWKSVTFSVTDVFNFIKAPRAQANFLSDADFLLSGDGIALGMHQVQKITIQPTTTSFGACFTVIPSEPVPERTSLVMKLNLTGEQNLYCLVKNARSFSDKRVSTYVHRPGEEIGLYHNYWPMFVKYEMLMPGVTLDIPVEMKLYLTRPTIGNDCEIEDGYDYAMCILKWANESYVKGSNCRTREQITAVMNSQC